MKKLLIAIGILGLLSSSAMADKWVIGKLTKIETWMSSTYYFMNPEGEAKECIMKFSPHSGMDTDARKLLSAVALTAMSTGKGIEVYVNGAGDCDETTPPNYPAQGVKIAD